jgi:hypothetical protein
MEAMMLDRIVEVFCEVDDFCKAFLPQWEASLLGTGGSAPRGPQPGLSISEIITLLLTVQASSISRASITASPSRCCAATFPACRATSTSSPCRKASSCRWWSSSSATSGPDSTTSIPPPLRQSSHQPAFAGLAQRGKMGWFFGFKLHLVFNTDNEIVALKLTPGNDTTPVPALT